MKLTPSQLSRVGQDCACLNARSTARILTKFYDDCLAPTGLKMTQFSILVTVAAYESVAVTKLAQALGLDRTTLTRSLKLLEDSGLVHIGVGDDIRSKAVRLSPYGSAALEEALPLWEKAQDVVHSKLDYDALMQQFRNVEQKKEALI